MDQHEWNMSQTAYRFTWDKETKQFKRKKKTDYLRYTKSVILCHETRDVWQICGYHAHVRMLISILRILTLWWIHHSEWWSGQHVICKRHHDGRLDECLHPGVEKLKQTDPFRLGISLRIFKSCKHVCPVNTMVEYLKIRKTWNNGRVSPALFIEEDGTPLTRNFFISKLKQLLNSLGYRDEKYNGHSFRIGAATSAASGNVEDHMIKTLGRSKYDCYNCYIRTDDDTLSRAQQAMCNKWINVIMHKWNSRLSQSRSVFAIPKDVIFPNAVQLCKNPHSWFPGMWFSIIICSSMLSNSNTCAV